MDNQFEFTSHDESRDNLSGSITDKIEYLTTLNKAVKEEDDRQVYQLINGEKYSQEISNLEDTKNNFNNEHLVDDIKLQISAFLSKKLIAYLEKTYPFFYFEEKAFGQYQFYFGNWWGRRLFGTLDVLNVAFKFNQTEYDKLSRSYELLNQKKRLNTDAIERLSDESDHLQDLIDQQKDRDERKAQLREQIKQSSQERVMPWESGKAREAKQKLVNELTRLTEEDEQANSAYSQIKDNETTILALSKEDTLMGYERQSINSTFGSFENFIDANNNLYRNYIASLIANQK